MTHSRTIRWGILGAGKIARSFVKDAPLLQNGTLVAIAARDIEKARAFATEFQVPMAMRYEELYTSKEVDAVYIATTHNFHFEQALQCIKNGKAVLVEKPITVNVREFNQLAAAAKEHQVFLMEALWTCFLPGLQKAKEWLQSGRIGKLKVITAEFAFPFKDNLPDRLFNPLLAGGSLLDLGIYPIAMASYFMDRKPLSIKASGVFTSTQVDESVGMLLDYGDVTASLLCSIATKMPNILRLMGEKGSIQLPLFWRGRTVNLYDTEDICTDVYEDTREAHGFIFEMQHATDQILAGNIESNIVSHTRSREWQETMMEVRRQINLHYPMDDYR